MALGARVAAGAPGAGYGTRGAPPPAGARSYGAGPALGLARGGMAGRGGPAPGRASLRRAARQSPRGGGARGRRRHATCHNQLMYPYCLLSVRNLYVCPLCVSALMNTFVIYIRMDKD